MVEHAAQAADEVLVTAVDGNADDDLASLRADVAPGWLQRTFTPRLWRGGRSPRALRPAPPAASLRADGNACAPAYGPSALGGNARRFLELTVTLARTEFKLRYFGSVLGYVWSLMRPLLFFGVLYVVFTQIFTFGKGIPHYGVYLLTSIVLWTLPGRGDRRLRPVPRPARSACCARSASRAW